MKQEVKRENLKNFYYTLQTLRIKIVFEYLMHVQRESEKRNQYELRKFFENYNDGPSYLFYYQLKKLRFSYLFTPLRKQIPMPTIRINTKSYDSLKLRTQF